MSIGHMKENSSYEYLDLPGTANLGSSRVDRRAGKGVTVTAVQPKLVIVADDLTGAADASAPFAARGMKTTIPLAGPLRPGPEVVAQVTDTRWRSGHDAAQLIAAAVRQAQAWRAMRLFVKVDSTLRGNVRSEVAAAATAWGAREIVAAVAFPQQGRIVRHGRLNVWGKDQGRVADLFPTGTVVLDAVNDHDLLQIAAQVNRASPAGRMVVGSAGLARALAAVMRPGPFGPRPWRPAAGVLVAVGTTHPVTRAQAQALIEAGVVRIGIGPRDLGPSAAATSVREAISVLQQSGAVLVSTDCGDPPVVDPGRLASALNRTVRGIVQAVPSAALVLTGGATALSVSTALGARELRLLGEFDAGIAVGELILDDHTVLVMTKSGGFGGPDLLRIATTTLEASR
jgi:uncharacterized protein YgbK (DUF1537 family)